MPTYDYECTSCGTTFELFQPITEPARKKLKKTDPKPCDCNAPVRRLIGTGGGIIFKGSGFYQTDYRGESYKKAEKADKEKASPTSKGDSSKSDPPKSDTSKSDRAKESGKKDGGKSGSGGGEKSQGAAVKE